MEHKDYRLAAILFTDIVGFSRMMEKDESGTLTLMDEHNTIIRGLVHDFKGNIIKTIGDAFLIEFSNATNAVKCAIEIQNKFEILNASNPPVPIVLRIGCHLGDIYFFENDALGEGINIASRLQSLSKPGRITISQEVYNVVMNKITTKIIPLGQVSLKNITREIRAYEIMTNGSNESLDASEVSIVEPNSTQIVVEKDEYAEIRDTVFSETKRLGRRVSVKEIQNLPAFSGRNIQVHLDKLTKLGFLSKEQGNQKVYDNEFNPSYERNSDDNDWREDRRENRRQERHERAKDFFENLASDIKDGVEKSGWFNFNKKPLTKEDHLRKLENRFLKQKSGFSGHISSFLGVNGLLFLIYFLTSPFGFPWPIIASLAWLIGLATHFTELKTLKQSIGQLREMKSLSDEQTSKVDKVLKGRRNFWNHLVSNLFTGVLLLGINLITHTEFLWALIPIGAMGIGVFSHFNKFKQTEREIIEDLNEDGVDTRPLFKRIIGALTFEKNRRNKKDTADDGVQNLKSRILKQFNELKGDHPFGDDFTSVLDDYVNQIQELSGRSKEIDQLLLSIPIHELRIDLNKAEEQLSNPSSDRMRVEVEKSSEQLHKQIKSYDEMVDEQQILKQRISNSVNGLRQMEIDLGRMKNLSVKGTIPNTQALRDQSEELKQYLTDLHQGYKETD